MTKFEEEFNYLIELSGKVLIGQVDAEAFEKNRIAFFERYETDQQQALPVVPECVAEWIEYVKKDELFNALGLLDNDNMPKDVDEWLFLQSNDDNINLILRAWLDGYQVKKPQLFYLRDELTGQFLAKDNQFKDKDRYFFWTGADPLTHSIGTAWKLTFTQEEIDSMETGSYEQIEAEE
ncbi:DUF1642 domain-containing protein [Lactococcus garvieae]|uniref:Hypothetical phage protein n=1 Tax=Lactococcus garvieae (strain Lg2) TaxID=420890 RepID=F9VE55_LACGL|nr:DUF1642 domain-containing protein [Lactococcus garvieae]YP_009279655.1 DUF1642 domain-containing protein [Lactococcus phage PLgT-1]ANA49654.1 hypothetical protein PlgT1_41 [Lactococcus phage PLgT-1]EOT33292.1 hypothetical protein OO3_00482 [Lactococcus garvieae ATCC 49156]EOT93331.1 hypothetical protein I578_00867 [Lactococcus garvieae ATCC 49156]BAK58639.1 hypothetical phage protein [Lactococcus garvieae ATCC 49156]BAK60606.1 hypothetical phage protein [Lactococcus garvieae Lg2]